MTDQVVPEPWHIPRALSNEALRLLTSLPMDEIERRLRGPAPAADGEVAKLVEAMRNQADDARQYTTFYLLHCAADLLERQAAAAPVARLPEDAQVIEPANRTILVPIPAPIPVSERLPGPEDCVPHPRTKRGNWCWGFVRCEVPLTRPARWMLMCMEVVEMEATHWLPAHALPLPEVNDD